MKERFFSHDLQKNYANDRKVKRERNRSNWKLVNAVESHTIASRTKETRQSIDRLTVSHDVAAVTAPRARCSPRELDVARLQTAGFPRECKISNPRRSADNESGSSIRRDSIMRAQLTVM